MKKWFLMMLAGLFIFFGGCAQGGPGENANETHGTDEMEKLEWVIGQLETAGSIEWERISYSGYQTENGEAFDQVYNDNQYVREPFAQWMRAEITNQDMQAFVTESFYEEKDGEMMLSMRSSQLAGDDWTEALTPWDTYPLSGVELETTKETMKTMLELYMTQLAYLLKNNISSFIPGDDTLEGKACIRYDGHIEPETVLDHYEKIGRGIYVQASTVEKKENLSREEMRNEIISSDTLSRIDHFHKILFSNTPAPVSIWIGTTSGAVLGIKIDLTEAETSYAKAVAPDDPRMIINRSIEYRNFVFNSLKTLEMPE